MHGMRRTNFVADVLLYTWSHLGVGLTKKTDIQSRSVCVAFFGSSVRSPAFHVHLTHLRNIGEIGLNISLSLGGVLG